ncbi:MAG: NAD(P)-dependent alcohol dehydrogenase [Thermoplasmata archaeon]|nr:NAD(P)-dependent alcohol dehydrogenase [Thermoplasmata archaeon]
MPKPTPRNNEVLIRIRATTVTAGDCELRGLQLSLGLRLLVRILMGPTKPRRKILGQEFAGEVESVGQTVTRFRKGDRVFGTTGFGFGAYAEYLCLPEKSNGRALARMPTNVGFNEAAAVPTGGLEALHFLRKAGDLRGQRVLIIGAGGGIGTFAVQLAKHFGAEVTAVDSPGRQDFLNSIGADRVVDYTREDSTQVSESYDVIFDVVGKSSFSNCIRALTEKGFYLLGNATLSSKARGLWTSMRGTKKVIFGAAAQRSEDLVFLGGLIESGRIRSVVDRTYPLEQTPAAHGYFESGRARGKIIIAP